MKRWRVILFFAVAGLLTLIAVLPQFSSFTFLYSVEQSALSLRFLLRGMESPEEDAAKIVIVAVDDRSLINDFQQADLESNPILKLLPKVGELPWPWNRTIHAFMVERIFDAGASVVAYDFVFPAANDGDIAFYAQSSHRA